MSTATSQLAAPCRELHVWHARDLRERAASRALLREALSAYAHAAPADLRFVTGPRGKPSLVSKSSGADVRFNLSHSGGRLLIAVTTGRDVGVDVEHVEGVRAAEGLVRFLAPAERALLEGCDAKRRRQVIAQLWTAKEAVLKATGEGICRSLRELDVAPAVATGTATLRRPVVGGSEIREWTVQLIDVGTGYAAAVAFEGGPAAGLTVLDWPDPD
jgi:4'-phosphopantetheinyl transferase